MVEVGPDDAYLRHVLGVHGADILKFQPDFVWDGAGTTTTPTSSSTATRPSVSCWSRTVVTESRRVVLDYVTTRFRDFSPGEFVWRQSGLLRSAGFTSVVTPAGMVAPYYERIGFTRDGRRVHARAGMTDQTEAEASTQRSRVA